MNYLQKIYSSEVNIEERMKTGEYITVADFATLHKIDVRRMYVAFNLSFFIGNKKCFRIDATEKILKVVESS